jgi:phosphoenolpyruvate synthase/pyruvate phosphate dikinase
MIGWRGASRYYDPKYRPAFELECKGLLKARNDMGLTNIKLMVPFCRTPEEGKKVIQVMRECPPGAGRERFGVVRDVRDSEQRHLRGCLCRHL